MIFTPEWITQKLTTVKEVAIEVPVGQPGLQPRLAFEGVTLKVDPRRLVVGVDAPQDDRLVTMERVAVAALTELPHTPITGVGVNFQFLEEEPEGLLLKAFEAPDLNPLADERFEVKSSQIRRELHRDGLVTNLALNLTNEGKVLIDFNFHHGGNLETAKTFLDKRVVGYKEQALDLLRRVYGLEL